MRRVQRHQTQQARNERRARQGHDPAAEDVEQLLPVDGADVVVHEGDAHGGADEALGGGDGEGERGGEQDGDGGAELDGEAAAGRHLGDAVAEGADDVVAVDPEADAEEETGDDEEPDGGAGLGVDEAGLPGLVGGCPGAAGGVVRDVVYCLTSSQDVRTYTALATSLLP